MSIRIATQPSHTEEYLHWRDEILQVMYWMSGEGLGDTVAPADLVSFLAVDENVISASWQALDDAYTFGLLHTSDTRP